MISDGNTQDFYQKALESLVLTKSALADVSVFWTLFVSGSAATDGKVWFWLKSFRGLYILHLLVLSGSQVEGLLRLLRGVYAKCLAIFSLNPSNNKNLVYGLKLLLTWFLWLFASATGWSAPITRASVLSALSIWLVRPRFIYLAVGAFLAQWIFFESHRSALGFYLSWVAYLFVVLLGFFKLPKWVAAAFISGALFVVVEVFCFQNPFQIQDFLLCLLANVVFCLVFDWVFMPIASWLILGSLVLALFKSTCAPCGEFLAFWTQPLGEALLVVIKWLMYT